MIVMFYHAFIYIVLKEHLKPSTTRFNIKQFHILPTKLTRSVNKVMRLIQYNSVLIFKPQIKFVHFKIVPLGGYTPSETLFPLFVATLVVANRNHF